MVGIVRKWGSPTLAQLTWAGHVSHAQKSGLSVNDLEKNGLVPWYEEKGVETGPACPSQTDRMHYWIFGLGPKDIPKTYGLCRATEYIAPTPPVLSDRWALSLCQIGGLEI